MISLIPTCVISPFVESSISFLLAIIWPEDRRKWYRDNNSYQLHKLNLVRGIYVKNQTTLSPPFCPLVQGTFFLCQSNDPVELNKHLPNYVCSYRKGVVLCDKLALSFIVAFLISGRGQSFPSRMGDFRCQSVQCDTDTYIINLLFIHTIRQNWNEPESCRIQITVEQTHLYFQIDE